MYKFKKTVQVFTEIKSRARQWEKDMLAFSVYRSRDEEAEGQGPWENRDQDKQVELSTQEPRP